MPTVIEIDPTCHAAYIRFKAAKVHRTISETKPGPVMSIDLDKNGRVVGIELVGVKEFSIAAIRRRLPERFRNINFDRAGFVPTPHCRAEPIAA